jgi:hypothetical protein
MLLTYREESMDTVEIYVNFMPYLRRIPEITEILGR